jgi:hypothetical protein
MTPNAMGVLLQLGINPKDGGAVPLEQVSSNIRLLALFSERLSSLMLS